VLWNSDLYGHVKGDMVLDMSVQDFTTFCIGTQDMMKLRNAGLNFLCLLSSITERVEEIG
jgi:hypothetical protein